MVVKFPFLFPTAMTDILEMTIFLNQPSQEHKSLEIYKLWDNIFAIFKHKIILLA